MAIFNTTVFLVRFLIYASVATFALFSTAKALLLFTKFVSCQTNETATIYLRSKTVSSSENHVEGAEELISHDHHLIHEDWHELLRMLGMDFLLLTLFILQHSFMACHWWKSRIFWLGLGVVERAMYVIATALTLQLMIENWQYTNSSMIWFVDTDGCAWLWLLFTVLHVLGWTLILGSTLLMDVCELVGIKQVYYFALGLESPISIKSSGLQRLYTGMRHPGTVALTLMLILHPHMTASRAMLSLVMMLYCLFRFDMDKENHSYLQQKLASKEDELNTMITTRYQHDEMSVHYVWAQSFHSST